MNKNKDKEMIKYRVFFRNGKFSKTETRHDPAIPVQMNHSLHTELRRGWFEVLKLSNKNPDVRMLKQITYEYIMYTFLLFHSTLQGASDIICSPCCHILPLFQGSTFTYSFIHSTIFYSTSAICQTLF